MVLSSSQVKVARASGRVSHDVRDVAIFHCADEATKDGYCFVAFTLGCQVFGLRRVGAPDQPGVCTDLATE
jgi:hypothetical protein